jgi:SH3-like domain-containing protein
VKAAAFALLLVPALALAGPATAIRPTEIRQAPRFDSVALARLAEGQRVEAFERRGGWTRVKDAGGNEGWVRMFMLRHTGGGTARQGDSGILAAINVARTGSSGRQVTTGVRGLDAEQLKNAKPDAVEFRKLEGYATSRDDAARFAAEGKLLARQVAYPKEAP